MVPARLSQPGWRTTTRNLGRAPVQEDARAVSGGRWVSRSAGKPPSCLQAKGRMCKRLVTRRNFQLRFRPTIVYDEFPNNQRLARRNSSSRLGRSSVTGSGSAARSEAVSWASMCSTVMPVDSITFCIFVRASFAFAPLAT